MAFIVSRVLGSVTPVQHDDSLGVVISSNRKMDWSYAGVTGGIPTSYTKSGDTIETGTAIATINTRISGAADNTYLEFAAGTHNLAGGIKIGRSNIALRGQGLSTILNFTASTAGGFFYGGGGGCVSVESSGISLAGYGSIPGITGVTPSTVQNWTGTNGAAGVYTQGATVINIESTTGLSAGGTLTLWQEDPVDTDLPDSGYFVSAKAGNGDNDNICRQGSGQTERAGVSQRCRIVSVDSSTQVTIGAPGIHRPVGTWGSRSIPPKAGWNTGIIKGIGIENLKITHSVSNCPYLIGFDVASECWIEGVGFVPPTTDSGDYCILMIDARNMTVRDSWLDEMAGGGITTTSYGTALFQSSDCLIENNIFNAVESPIEALSGTTGCVFAYNYEFGAGAEGGMQAHEDGASMNLFEGNVARKFWADFFHGNTTLNTIFRNHLYVRGVDLCSYHRWYNIVANVMAATTAYKSLVTDGTRYDRFQTIGVRLGYPSNTNSNVNDADTYFMSPDSQVGTSAMIWGNYTNFDDDTVWDEDEVPDADALFPNPVPGNHLLPSSYYLSSEPAFWATSSSPWPGIGPDVTGGDITGYGGHAYSNPAKEMYEACSGDIDNFDPADYY